MKCPKCGYLGFEDVDRCRNCGYDFSLVSAAALPELALRGEHEELSPLDDLALVDAAASYSNGRATPGAESAHRPAAAHALFPSGELPLFGSPAPDETAADDTPLITRTSPPRIPLAVRRATPDVPRLRSAPRMRTPMLDLNAFEPEFESPRVPRRVEEPLRPAGESRTASTERSDEPAGVASRIGAAVADLLILAAIDVVVVYFTMRISGVTVEEWNLLPIAPLVAFLAAQNLGYFVGFTIGGQTLGKMAAGIKVVSVQDGAPLDFGQSLLRTLVWVALAVPAGLGFLTALFGDDHRGLHDRCAGTKVVRASA